MNYNVYLYIYIMIYSVVLGDWKPICNLKQNLGGPPCMWIHPTMIVQGCRPQNSHVALDSPREL